MSSSGHPSRSSRTTRQAALYEPDDPTQVKEQYRAQMLLYAVSGARGDRHLAGPSHPYPARRAPPSASKSFQLKPKKRHARALADLARYNNAVEAGRDPSIIAAPSPEACSFRPYAIECPAFWTTADPSWESDGVAAVAGEILAPRPHGMARSPLSCE